MIKLENYEVMGWEHAIRGMRNPMNSWEKGDSLECIYSCDDCENFNICQNNDGEYFKEFWENGCHGKDYAIGPNDHSLMMRLRNAGTDHRKYMRMITVYVDITAPLYWWKEFDTYKVGTVANSCSTMHKIHEKEFTLEDFSCEKLIDDNSDFMLELEMLYFEDDNEAAANGVDVESELYYTSPMSDLQYTIKKLNVYRRLHNNATDKAKKVRWFDHMIQTLPSSYNQKRTIMLNYEVLANMYKSRKNHKLDEWREFCKWIEGLPYSELITGVKEK